MPSKSLSKDQSKLISTGFLDSLGAPQSTVRLNATAKAIIELAGEVMQDASDNLNKGNNVSSGKLISEMEQEITVDPNFLQTVVKMLDYGFFQDEGVNGTKQQQGSRFSFKNAGVSKKFVESIRKWAIRENLGAKRFKRKLGKETKSGVASNEDAAYAIALAIKRRGIKPKHFMTKAIEKLEQKLTNDKTLAAFKIDVLRALDDL